MAMGLVPKRSSKGFSFNVEEIGNGYLCHYGPDTWFFPNKDDLVKYITDLIEEI